MTLYLKIEKVRVDKISSFVPAYTSALEANVNLSPFTRVFQSYDFDTKHTREQKMELKRSHALLKITKNVVKITRFQIPTFQFTSYHSSPFIDESSNETTLNVLHGNVIKSGSLQFSNRLLNIHVKRCNLDHAQKLFDDIPNKDVRSWTILLSGYAQSGNFQLGLNHFMNMLRDGLCPNQFTLSSAFKCCSSGNAVRAGEAIHGWIIQNGIGLDTVLENSLLDFYVKCGGFDSAVRLFEDMNEKDIVSWNIMIGACLMNGDTEKALVLFRRMPVKDVVSWNTIVDGLMHNGAEMGALELLYQMTENGFFFSEVTYSMSLMLVSSLLLLKLGRQIHGRLLRFGINNNGFVVSSLIDMYNKCGEMEKAFVVFNATSRDSARPIVEAVAWSSMVSGYVQHSRWKEALTTFLLMVRQGVHIDKFTLTSIVSACANAGILELGKLTHAHVHKIGHNPDVFMCSSLVDMYSKCGSLNDARSIFEQTRDKNVVLWTSMIFGCALHGQGRNAICLIDLMIGEGIRPNEITFVGVLTACSHAGLIQEGKKYFNLMREVYNIKPGIEHFTCMVDMFGRAGRLNEAKEFIQENRIAHLSTVWMSFLSSCRLHKNFEMGKWVAAKLLVLEPSNAGHYILLSNTCATDQRWDEAAQIRNLMHQRGIKKTPGQSWILLNNEIHTFVMGDRSHSQDTEIYLYLDELTGKLKEIGYSADVEVVMQDVGEEQGEVLVGFHSERLAIAFGIINTSPETPIRIMKNLRICTDCHNFVKFTSQLLSREIIVRDIHRFHHFKHGLCSCGDYW